MSFRTTAGYENVDGSGQFVDGDLFRTNAVFAADLDGDGDNDLLTAEALVGRVRWYENQLLQASIPGDSNRDGIFNSSDLVLVFQAGRYEDKIEGNASFEEGDWNADGDFDSSDLVFAFQEDNYVSGASAELFRYSFGVGDRTEWHHRTDEYFDTFQRQVTGQAVGRLPMLGPIVTDPISLTL